MTVNLYNGNPGRMEILFTTVTVHACGNSANLREYLRILRQYWILLLRIAIDPWTKLFIRVMPD